MGRRRELLELLRVAAGARRGPDELVLSRRRPSGARPERGDGGLAEGQRRGSEYERAHDGELELGYER
jgi:hypothetical protein